MRFQVSHHPEEGWHRIRLHDSHTGCSADIIPEAGAILNAFSIPTTQGICNVMDGFSSFADWKNRIEKGFHSAKLSPFVCRLKGSSFEWHGRTLSIQKFLLNGTAIHGILYDAPFQVIEEGIHEDFAEVELKYAYRGDVAGFPFPYDCLIRYRLEDQQTLLVSTVVHNRGQESMPMADGWHPYFSFGGGINGLMLQFHASQMLEYDADILPTGRLLSQQEWKSPQTIGDRFLDNGFVLDKGHPSPACILSDPASGLRLSFLPEDAYPYLQIYTPPHRQSIAIELLSAAPDAFNNGMGLYTLAPQEAKTFSLRYRLEQLG